MQELFDFSTLYQTNPIFSEPDLRFSCNFEKLKDWWHHLCLSKKAAICRLDLPEIIHDLKETSNGAFLLCNLNAQYKQKALITCKRHGNKTNKDLLTHEYEFNFKDKDMLPINSARIFSTYHLQIYNTLDLSAKSLSEDISGTSEQSTIQIKKEYLNDVPDMLRNFIADFAMENQLLLRKEEYGKIYSVLSEYSFNKLLIFRQIQSSSVQRLLHKLVAVTIILGNNVMIQHQKYISASLCNQTLQIPTIEANSDLATDDTKVHSFCFRTQDIKSLSSIQPNGHDNRKFSELETEISNEADIQIHQNTSNENLKNLSQSQDSNTKETSHGHSIQSNDSTIIPYLFPQHLGFPVSAKENMASGASVSGIESENQGGEYNRMFGDFLSMYEGYQICNLQIDFEPSDAFLIKLGSNEEIVYEQPSESYESLVARKYSSNPLYGKRNLTSGADDFGMQKNATDTLDTNEVFSIGNMYGYYGAGWTTPRRGKAHDERGAWRTGENLSHEKKEAPMESRIYGGIRETLPWGEDSYAKDYGHKGHFKGQGGKKEVKIYYAKAKNNGDVQKKTQQPRFQSRKEGLVET